MPWQWIWFRRGLGFLAWSVFSYLIGLLVWVCLSWNGDFVDYSFAAFLTVVWVGVTGLALFGPEEMWDSGG